MQNDFCNPQGALFVPNADADAIRLAQFIGRHAQSIDGIILTHDTHHAIDISHPLFWTDAQGNSPDPFTTITADDVRQNRWVARESDIRQLVLQYLIQLEEQGEFPHTIWPEHCLWGSEGAATPPVLANALADWCHLGRRYRVVQKGINPYCEHFGALRANVTLTNDSSTQLNEELLQELDAYDRIYIAGEARSHCVANTLKQLLSFPHLIKKVVMLEDCMSSIPNTEKQAAPIYERAAAMGATFCKASDINL